MLILKTAASVAAYLTEQKKSGQRIGFVPTMGALHAGHLSLVKNALAENDFVITSIFVNPRQFNEKKDLDNYPVTFERDLELLVKFGNHLLFKPPVGEIYKSTATPQIDVDFGDLLKTMEATLRYGHFDGVVQVMQRLLEIVQPHKLYMGQKDYQQFLIIKKLVEKNFPETEIKMVETMREHDGLAMSSRNMLLTTEQRKAAVNISKTLFEAREQFSKMPLNIVRQKSIEKLNQNPLLKTEYFEIVDKETLQPLNSSHINSAIICAAVRVGEIRLIDNVEVK